MGKAQKLKKQRKEEKALREKKQSEQRKITLTTVVTIILVVVGGFWLNNWYQQKQSAGQNGNQVVIHTNMGDIKLAMFKDAAPKTVENFLGLANSGYYDGTKFHRVIKDFMIQGGDPLSKDNDPANDGTGGESKWKNKFEDEINPWSLGLDEATITNLQAAGYTYRQDLNSVKMRPGVIAMANSGPNTNGSQFFIVTSQDQPHLDGRHTVFGEVIEGMEVVLAIANVATGDNDRPATDVIINSLEVIEGNPDGEENDMSLPVMVEPLEGDNTTGIQIENISYE